MRVVPLFGEVVHLKVALCHCALGMDHTLWDPLAVEAEQPLLDLIILQEHRA